MKLKALFFTLALALTANLTANAQEGTYNEEDCKKFRSLYYQYLKQKMYADACMFWSKAVSNCGDSLDGKFWSNGRVAYLKLQKTVDESNTARIKEIDDTLAWIYEQRMLIEKDPDWELDYAVMLVSNKSEDFDKMDKLFENIHVMKEKSSYSHIRAYFRHLILNKFNKAPQEEKEGIRATIIDEYITLSEYCSAAIKGLKAKGDDRSLKYVKGYESAQSFLDKYFLKIAQDCEVLLPVLDKKFETLPADKEPRLKQVNKFIGLMERQKCTESDTYAKFVEESVAVNPTAAGYAGLGNVQLNKGEESKAVESFKKAVEMEADGDKKNDYLLGLANAQYKAHQYKAAFSTAKQVEGDLRGKAMIICGNAVAATANSCGESTFSRKANYWLANDYYKKAASLGESVSSGKFLSSAPDQNEGFNEGVSAGATVTLSCWGESTTARY
jgi:tetratricopeptide (TPR) repeat protein